MGAIQAGEISRPCDLKHRGLKPDEGDSQHHGGKPTGSQQRQVEVQEGRNHSVTHVVVLAVGVQASGWTQRGI